MNKHNYKLHLSNGEARVGELENNLNLEETGAQFLKLLNGDYISDFSGDKLIIIPTKNIIYVEFF